MRSPSESGQTTVLVLGLSLVTFAVAGLAVDGTRAFLYRRSLQNAADAAAVAAAGELDARSYYASGGRSVLLDPRLAERQAEALIGVRALPGSVSVRADSGGVTVVLHSRLGTSFLGLVGIDSIPVAVQARARPFAGPPA